MHKISLVKITQLFISLLGLSPTTKQTYVVQSREDTKTRGYKKYHTYTGRVGGASNDAKITMSVNRIYVAR